MSNDYVYDNETYPNVFTLAVEHAEAPIRWAFEISDQRNDSKEIIEFLRYLADTKARMVGFNNLGFDYPVLHTLMQMGYSDAQTLSLVFSSSCSATARWRWRSGKSTLRPSWA